MFGYLYAMWAEESSPTGYIARVLPDRGRDAPVDMPVAAAVYAMGQDPKYRFPMLTEYCWYMTVENGVLTGLEEGMTGHMCGQYSFGTPETVGSVLRLEGDEVVFTGFADQMARGVIVYYDDYKYLAAPPIEAGSRAALSPDCRFLCLDWNAGDRHYTPISRETAEAILGDNVRWITLYDLYADTPGIDCAALFRNDDPSHYAQGGDLARIAQNPDFIPE